MDSLPKGKDRSRSEREKLQGLSLGGKLSYIWSYYAYYIVGAVVGLILLITLSSTCSRSRVDLSIIWSASVEEREGLDRFNEFVKERVFGQDSEMDVQTLLFASIEDDPELDMQNSSRVAAMLAAEMIDIFIFNTEMLVVYSLVENIMPLEGILDEIKSISPAVYDVISEHVRIADFGYTQRTAAERIAGIRINDSPLMIELGFKSPFDVYLCVAISSQNLNYVTQTIIAFFE